VWFDQGALALAYTGTAIEVEPGDTLSRPATVLASARPGPAGITARIGGLAVIRPTST
jgi:hypothetical protein